MKRLFAAIVALVLAAIWFLPSKNPPEYHNVFHSGIYPSYREQLQAAAGIRFETHAEFVERFRQNPHPQVGEWIFTGAELNSPFLELLARFVELPAGDIASIEQAYRKLKGNKTLGKPLYKSWSNDPYGLGNLPSHVFTIGKTRLVRMAKPTVDDKPSPEFLSFIGGGEGHLYVNLLKRHGSEATATRHLEALDLPNFYIITLSKDSIFYKQKDDLDIETELFKQVFLVELQGEDYHWSKGLDRWNPALVDQVQRRYFPDKTSLTAEERQDFIELFYVALLDKLTEELQPASANISCCHGMDRGPSLLALWMYSRGAKEEAAALLLGAPVMIHNRAPHGSRFKRFLSAAKRLS